MIAIARPQHLSLVEWESLSEPERRRLVQEHSKQHPSTNPEAQKAQALFERIKTQRAWVDSLKALWSELFPEFPVPPDNQFKVWINWHHDFDRVVYGMEAGHRWYSQKIETVGEEKFIPPSREYVRSYISGCIKQGPKDTDNGQSA